MSAAEPESSDDLTPEQRRQRVIALLARAVMRRVRWLRRCESTTQTDSQSQSDPRHDLVLVNREISV